MSGSNKFSRGAGRGLNRMGPPPLGRGMVPLRRGQPPGKEKGRPDDSSKGRGLAMKGNSTGIGSAGGTQGEDFQLESCREQGALPLYAMAIRLTPGMLETLKRVEELGETTTMKFGVNNSGHVIKVGEEEFRFSSAPEPGELCDIYEEQRRGEDGNGLLVEAGAVWRKLSVIRTLSATDKATVKARSVEAERQQKSRKAIILDHSNSLMNNKAATAGDANGRRLPVTAKPKKEPPQKKRKIGVPVIPPLSAVKTRPTPPMIEKAPLAAPTSKVGKTTSVSSPPDGPPISSRPPPSQGALMPPFKPKSVVAEEVGGAAKTVSISHKDKLSSPALATGGETAPVAKTAGVVNMSELRNCLITLLVDNPKGMTIKAVEKALGEAMPNVRPDKKQIEKVIKAIASYHAPGKYMLKEGVEKGAFAKPSPGSGSSPDTPPVDSPPLGDMPALMENAPEAQQEIAGSGEDSTVASRQDLKRNDGTSRNSTLPVRGGESAVTRAIRRAGEMVRGNAEKLLSGLDKSRTAVESSGHKLDDSSRKDSTEGPEIGDADHVSIGGDESPVVGSPDIKNEGKFNGLEVEHDGQDPQSLGSPHLLGVDNKKENSDGSDSSSSSSSSSGSGSDSDSESASGSRSGSGSDTDSDGSSSSASEEENMDEDVDIISDDEDKASVDVVPETSKQKSKSKEIRTSLERQESRVQKQAFRGKKQKQKGSDTGMTPHESEDADIGDGGEVGEISQFVDQEAAEKGAKGSNSEEEVDVVSSDEDAPSPSKRRMSSPMESGERNDNAIDADFELHSNFPSMEEVKGGQGSLHAAVPARSGSESDHSIEEYETRAETSGVRGARVKAIGDQKDDVLERKMEGVDNVVSLRSKGLGGIKGEETPHSVERESKTDVAGIAPTLKGFDMADGQMMSREHFVPGGVPLRSDNQQKSLLGTPPMLRDGQHREGPVKAKAVESKRKGFSKNVETGEIQEKAVTAHRGPQRFRKMMEPPGRTAKFSDVSLKTPGEGETNAKAADGFSKPSEEPSLMGKGPESRETSTVDRPVKSSRDGDILERHDVHRKRNKEAGLLAKPGKASEANSDKNSNLVGKPGRDAKQAKKLVEKLDGLKRAEPSERAVTGSEFGDKVPKDTEIQRRLPRDGETWRKSPKIIESGSRIGSDNEVHSARLKDLQKPDCEQSEAAKTKVSRMNSDLELGELRDIVAGEELRPKDSLRQDALKSREGSDLLPRQPQSKAHVSPEKDKPRNTGKLGDVKKRPPADLKKQQLAKESQKADISGPSRDTVRPALSGQKFGAGLDDKLDVGNNRVGEAPKTFGDHNEKHTEGRNGKRLADDSGNHELGRPFKRTVFEQSQAATSVGRGEPDAAPKISALDIGKSNLADGGNQLPATNNKSMGDNGPVLGPKSKGQEVMDKDVVDKRGFGFDGKQKTTAGLLGPGTKNDAQSNGKRRSNQPRDAQSREFFALYEKRAPELKGPILQYDQYLEYCKEYNEKYPVYARLNTVLESDREDFENFSRDITLAKAAEDKNKLELIYGKVRKDFIQCSKRFKRMQKTFLILHDELKVIKQRCKEYADKLAQG
ncbi:unnamed protein product [Calypogeia fissa]